MFSLPVRHRLRSALRRLFRARAAKRLTLVFDEYDAAAAGMTRNNLYDAAAGMTRNELYDAAAAYLSTKISPNTKRLNVTKAPKDKNLKIRSEKGERIVDSYQGIELRWTFVCAEPEKGGPGEPLKGALMNVEKKHLELSFDKRHRETVVASYLPFVLEQAKAMGREDGVLKMHTLSNAMPQAMPRPMPQAMPYPMPQPMPHPMPGGTKWESVALEHPATFDTLAMDKALKAAVLEDLDLFARRKEFYRRVGRAWKRGYLLYGPPGTGKSSLVAAIAKHLNYDVYDLQRANVFTNSNYLQRLLLSTANRSILVIDLPDYVLGGAGAGAGGGGGRKKSDNKQKQYHSSSRTFTTLLNSIDGVWSSCGDERIIIFTTNHKDPLDPALIRPGLIDMHIHMSYCSYQGFKVLASNYLGLRAGHKLFGEIELLIDEAKVTPAQVTEELMRSEDVDVALEGLVKLLKRKKIEGDEKDEDEDESEEETDDGED